MNTIISSFDARSPRRTIATLVSRAFAVNPPLGLLGMAMLAALALTLVGLAVDPRAITGTPAWLKPAKFAISIVIYSFTLLWMFTFIPGRRRFVRLASLAIAAALSIEMAIIGLQVVRGTTSHFNVATILDAALWSTMAVLILVVWLLTLATARACGPPRTSRSAIMPSPTSRTAATSELPYTLLSRGD